MVDRKLAVEEKKDEVKTRRNIVDPPQFWVTFETVEISSPCHPRSAIALCQHHPNRSGCQGKRLASAALGDSISLLEHVTTGSAIMSRYVTQH